MLKISQQKILERWDSLPPVLHEALASDINSDFLWKTCESEFIPVEKISSIARVVGDVLMGFLHPEDMAAEISSSVNIDMRIATSITKTINQRIFTPIRPDIDKVYNPITKESKNVEEIRPVVKTLTSAPVSLASFSSPGPTSVNISAPQKQESIKSIPSGAAAPSDEFTRLGNNTTPSSAAPKPVILQSESVPRPIPNAPNFRIPTSAENVMSGRVSKPLPTAPAVVEFGAAPAPRIAPQQSTATPKISVVRYGSEKSAPPIMPPRPEPTRTITEITPETLKTIVPSPPKPPTGPSFAPLSQIPVPSPAVLKPSITASAPIPPLVPKPIAQIPKPANQPEKVIQKDYSVETK